MTGTRGGDGGQPGAVATPSLAYTCYRSVVTAGRGGTEIIGLGSSARRSRQERVKIAAVTV
jgi:hypothetical protein